MGHAAASPPPPGAPPSGARLWLAGARPRTLPASAVPVVVGTALSQAEGGALLLRALACLVVSVALQVGTNYANDYSDGVRGTDSDRVGPLRLVGSGIVAPSAVKAAAAIAFATAAIAGLLLAAVAGWWLIGVGAASIAAGWLYTGGPRPYGYAGLGELFVFVFFGLVATVGTAYVQIGRLTGPELAVGCALGLLAVALLVVNNLRDLAGDAASGKRTLATRIGDPLTRRLYGGCLVGSFAVIFGIGLWRPWTFLAFAALPLALAPLRRVAAGAAGRELIEVLGETGRTQLAVGALLALGLVL